MARNANQKLLEENIRHALGLQDTESLTIAQIVAALNELDDQLFEQLQLALTRLPPDAFSVTRLDQMLEQVRALNKAAYDNVEFLLGEAMKEISAYEAGYQAQLFETVIPKEVLTRALATGIVTIEQTAASILARPFEGRILKDWASSMEEHRLRRIKDTINVGYVQNKTTDEIVRELRGTRSAGYADGSFNADRRTVETVTRTALGHTAAYARNTFYAANPDIIKALQWLSTLDTSTSEICILRDKKLYTLGSDDEQPKPIGHKLTWLGGPGQAHWCCRSSSVPVLKSLREMGVDEDDFMGSSRASMDGAVPNTMDYEAFLRNSSPERQDEVLGPTRAKLFRSGVPLSKFATDRGHWLTIDELKQRDDKAFRTLRD